MWRCASPPSRCGWGAECEVGRVRSRADAKSAGCEPDDDDDDEEGKRCLALLGYRGTTTTPNTRSSGALACLDRVEIPGTGAMEDNDGEEKREEEDDDEERLG